MNNNKIIKYINYFFRLLIIGAVAALLSACGSAEIGTTNTPIFTSDVAISVTENNIATGYTAIATDADGDNLIYSLSGGSDQSKFSIDSESGVLSFIAAPDFEVLEDSDGNNSYEVEITASDGSNSVTHNVTVTVTNNDNENIPEFTSDNFISIAENNTTTGYTAAATDTDGNTLTYNLATGLDGSKFSIDTNSGVLTFIAAPDFDAPSDSDGNNTYIVDITVSDGSNSALQRVTITVNNINDNLPVFTSGNAISVVENNIVTEYTAAATDADGDSLTYSINNTAGLDGSKFSVDANSGVLTFIAVPDFDAPGDSDGNNTYIVDIAVTDGNNPVVQRVAITVNNINESSPVFTSGTAISVVENIITTGYTATATDVDGDSLTYSINNTAGLDGSTFSIDVNSGVLSFITAPDFDVPTDNDSNNTYIVDITVTDDSNSVVQRVTITVNNINDNSPVFTSGTAISVVENIVATGYTATATDLDGDSLTYNISNTAGLDGSKFSIDVNSGVLSFITAPDFDVPTDNDSNNTYIVDIAVTDDSNSVMQRVTITVNNINDNSPVFTSGTAISVVENIVATGYTATATDADEDTLTYSISATVALDGSQFSIDTNSGVLSFITAPDFDVPTDNDSNNTYIVDIAVTDDSNSVVQRVTITVNNINDNSPVFTSGSAISVVENIIATGYTATATDADEDTLTYSISATVALDGSKFSIDANSGVLSFITAPDFDVPTDNDSNNTYIVDIAVTDDSNSVVQRVTITVNNINDNSPVFTSGTAISVVENIIATGYTATATDLDGDSLTYNINNTAGLDGSKFSIDANSGVLSFITAPDFDVPTDNDSNNTYIVDIAVTDDSNSVVQRVTITVNNINDNSPVFTSGSAISVVENIIATGYTATATDADEDTLTYSISATVALDGSKFSIDANSGVLSFITAPDFDVPTDNDSNNTYIVDIAVTDGSNSVVQNVTVTVTSDSTSGNSPIFTSDTAINVDENIVASGYTATATDADEDTLTYSINDTDGLDGSEFSIDASSGVLSFIAAPDFESATDSDSNNTYIVDIAVTDGSNSVAQVVTVTVNNINDNSPVNTGGNNISISVDENIIATGYTPAATDADGDSLTYSISGGIDSAIFSVDSNSGILSFLTARDFENPTGNGNDNRYHVVIDVTDGSNSVSQSVNVTVDNVNDNPPIFNSATVISVPENNTATGYKAFVLDPDGYRDAFVFSLSGGVDHERFSIDTNSGVLSFNTAPDFEDINYIGDNNNYVVEITASDGIHSVEQSVTVSVTDAPGVLEFNATASDVKTIQFKWAAYDGATEYKLLIDPDGEGGVSDFTEVQANLTSTSTTQELPIHLTDWINARYILEAHDDTGMLEQSSPISITALMLSSIAYIKASNTDAGDTFGYYAVSLSGDGNTLAVGSYTEDSHSQGINAGDEDDNSESTSGAVYVFSRNGNSWSQQAYIKASNAEGGDQFGYAVSLSVDGNALAVGAPLEDSMAIGINNNALENNNSLSNSGAVYLFNRIGSSWNQQAYVKASVPDRFDQFGRFVSLSSDSNTLVVGVPFEDSSATGIDGDKTNNSLRSSGAAYVFSYDGIGWNEQAYIKASTPGQNDWFGWSVSLAADGNTLAVGAHTEDGIAGGNSGAVYVFSRSGISWSQQAYLKASNAGGGDLFGEAISLSDDGNTLAVGAQSEDSNAVGIDGVNNSSASGSGAVYVFNRNGIIWDQQAYVKASNTSSGDSFGIALSLSDDGTTLAVGATSEDSNASGIGGDQANNSSSQSGAVYVFKLNATTWSQQSYVKAKFNGSTDLFGWAISLSADGGTLAVAAPQEESSAKGINGDPNNNQAEDSGAVYLY